MAYIDIKIANHQPCTEANPEAAGSYVGNLHRWGDRGIEHTFIQFGKEDPSDIPIGALASVALQIAEARARGYRKKEQVPFDALIGMTILRACVHPYETPAGRKYVELVGESVESFGFVPDINYVYSARYTRSPNKLSMHGVSTRVMVDLPGKPELVTAQHLLATPAQERDFPVTHAVPALPAAYRRKDAWIALRAMPEETRFVETLISHEELMDTFQPAG